MRIGDMRISKNQYLRIKGDKNKEELKLYDKYDYLSLNEIDGILNKQRLIKNGGIKVTYYN